MNKCPKCDRIVIEVRADEISIGGRWHGVSYNCPFCFTILSVAVDPVSLKTDTVAEIEDALGPIRELLNQIAVRLNQTP